LPETTQATDQVGSIGVYTTIADWNAHYADYYKLPVSDVYATQSTDKNGDYRKALAGDTSALEADLSVLADQFINTVAANRGNRIKGDAWKTGKMFYSKDAQKVGLIDGQKSFDQIVKRMNTLISDRKKSSSKSSNNMAFEKTMTAAKATAFAVTDDGFTLTEANLNNVEAELTRLGAVEATVATLNTTVTNLNGEVAALTTAATAASEKATADAATIANLQAQVVALGKGASGKGSVVTTKKDETAGEGGNEPSYAKADHPANEWADKQAAKKSKTDYKSLITQ